MEKMGFWKGFWEYLKGKKYDWVLAGLLMIPYLVWYVWFMIKNRYWF